MRRRGKHCHPVLRSVEVNPTVQVLLPLAACIRETAEYCASRQAFGRPLLANQSIHFTLAELWTELELLRAGLYQVQNSSHKKTRP